MRTNMTTISVYLPQELDKMYYLMALERNISKSALIIEALRHYAESQNKGKEPVSGGIPDNGEPTDTKTIPITG